MEKALKEVGNWPQQQAITTASSNIQYPVVLPFSFSPLKLISMAAGGKR